MWSSACSGQGLLPGLTSPAQALAPSALYDMVRSNGQLPASVCKAIKRIAVCLSNIADRQCLPAARARGAADGCLQQLAGLTANEVRRMPYNLLQ